MRAGVCYAFQWEVCGGAWSVACGVLVDIPIQEETVQGRELAVGTAGEPARSLTLLRQNAPPGRAGMNGKESPPKLQRRGATGYGEFRHPHQEAPCGSTGSFTWVEYLWMCLPIAFVLTGGALGLLVGVTAVYSSARIFRGRCSTISKYGLSALVSVAAVLAFLVLVGIAEVLVAGVPG